MFPLSHSPCSPTLYTNGSCYITVQYVIWFTMESVLAASITFNKYSFIITSWAAKQGPVDRQLDTSALHTIVEKVKSGK